MSITPEQKNKLEKFGAFTQKVGVHPQLPINDMLDEINTTLKTLIPEQKDVQKVSLEGVEVVTLKGEKGDKGDIGEQGIQGEKGDTGADSTVAGPRGDRGEMGEPGLDGLDGEDGKDGVDGKDGSPDTPQQVRDKLETLTEEERLDISAIKGMEKTIADIKSSNKTVQFRGGTVPIAITNAGVMVDKNVRYINFVGSGVNSVVRSGTGVVTVTISGGGGGTTYTETPTGNIDGVNVTYTTAHTITTVLMFAINGQFLHPTTDYTFTGTTITMTSALDVSLSGLPFTIVYQ